MSSSILTALTAPTSFTDLDLSRLSGSSNTEPQHRYGMRQWSAWEDFTYDNIVAIFGRELAQTYRGDREPNLVSRDLIQFNEATVHQALLRLPVATVNYALAQQSRTPPHFGDGCRVQLENRLKPDWSVISDNNTNASGRYDNRVVGDTKISVKWKPSMINTKFREWSKPIDQLVGYMAYAKRRYGFIATDAAVVVLRLARKDTGAGTAAGKRPERKARRGTTAYDEGSDTGTGEAVAPSSPEYRDDEPANWQLYLEHAIIPWRAPQNCDDKRLTPKLALWALAMMATYGESRIDYAYPQLNTWRTLANGRIRHNTSGEELPGPRAGCIMQEPGANAPTGSGTSSGTASGGPSRGRSHGPSPGVEHALPIISLAPPVPSLPAQLRDSSSSSADSRRIEVTVVPVGTRYYFKDHRGVEQTSRARDWTRVRGGYVCHFENHTYFTDNIN